MFDWQPIDKLKALPEAKAVALYNSTAAVIVGERVGAFNVTKKATWNFGSKCWQHEGVDTPTHFTILMPIPDVRSNS